MKLKKGDSILVISGKDRGKTAKILKSFPREMRVLVEGVNLKTRHVKPRRQGESGQVVKAPAPVHVSSLKLLCPKCGKAARVGYKISGKEKFRICKKCQSAI